MLLLTVLQRRQLILPALVEWKEEEGKVLVERIVDSATGKAVGTPSVCGGGRRKKEKF